MVLSGNMISEDGGNRSRRKWKPNVQSKKLYSEILDRHIPFKVTAHALRCIDKAGGLDAYILNTPDKKMGSDVGAALRAEMLASGMVPPPPGPPGWRGAPAANGAPAAAPGGGAADAQQGPEQSAGHPGAAMPG
jgi:large subunit ribosomal protein L28